MKGKFQYGATTVPSGSNSQFLDPSVLSMMSSSTTSSSALMQLITIFQANCERVFPSIRDQFPDRMNFLVEELTAMDAALQNNDPLPTNHNIPDHLLPNDNAKKATPKNDMLGILLMGQYLGYYKRNRERIEDMNLTVDHFQRCHPEIYDAAIKKLSYDIADEDSVHALVEIWKILFIFIHKMKFNSKHAIRVAADFLCTAKHSRLSQGGELTLFSEFVELIFHKVTGKPKEHRRKAKKETKNRFKRKPLDVLFQYPTCGCGICYDSQTPKLFIVYTKWDNAYYDGDTLTSLGWHMVSECLSDDCASSLDSTTL